MCVASIAWYWFINFLFLVSTLKENLFSKHANENDKIHTFFSFFAMIYPAFAEFLAGINASESLKVKSLIYLIRFVISYKTFKTAVSNILYVWRHMSPIVH